MAYTTFTELSAGLGRSKGLVNEHVSFGQATRQDTRRCCSKKGRGVAFPAPPGGLAAWRKRRTSQHTIQRSVHTVASISLPDLGPGIQAWNFHHKRPLHTPCTLRSPGRIGQTRRVMLFTTSHTKQAINAAAADSAHGRRKHARGRHAFSKTGIDDGEYCGPVAGAAFKQMVTLLPLWLGGRRANVKQLHCGCASSICSWLSRPSWSNPCAGHT